MYIQILETDGFTVLQWLIQCYKGNRGWHVTHFDSFFTALKPSFTLFWRHRQRHLLQKNVTLNKELHTLNKIATSCRHKKKTTSFGLIINKFDVTKCQTRQCGSKGQSSPLPLSFPCARMFGFPQIINWLQVGWMYVTLAIWITTLGVEIKIT